MKRKILAAFLAAVLVFTMVPLQAFAEEESLTLREDSAILEDLAESWMSVSEAASNLGSQLGEGSASTFFSNAFSTISSAVSTLSPAFSVLTAINGSVNFLRLIGVMEDPTKNALADIQESLNGIKAQLHNMDEKLDNINNQMAKIEASIEFNDRAERSRDMYTSWNNFEQNYMEKDLDEKIHSFNTFTLNNLKKWFEATDTERKFGNIDTSMVLVKYVDNKLVHTLESSIPSSVNENEKYVLISSTSIPKNNDLTWDQDHVVKSEEEKLLELLKVHRNELETANCSYETASDNELSKLAEDAVSALNYRILAKAVRSEYETELSQILYSFQTYCTNLIKAGNGADARINAMYLSHAFEFEIGQDLIDFIDQMIFKTGSYALLVQDLMGMSSLVTESEKKSTLDLFNNTIKYLEEAKESCVTGYPNYCYLTNSLIDLSTISYENTITANIDDNGKYHSYKGTSSSAISRKLGGSGTMVDDVRMQIIYNTLSSNGNGHNLISYLQNGLPSRTGNYQYIVTSERGNKDFPKDSSESLYYYRAAGTWLGNSDPTYHTSGSISLKSLPSDFDEEHIVDHRCYTGNVFDTTAEKLLSNFTLHATATYAESSMWWFTDEVYFFGGPNRGRNFKFEDTNNREDYWHIPYVTYKQTNRNTYNTLLATKYTPSLLSTGNGKYNSLSSLKEINDKILSPLTFEEPKSEKGSVTVHISSSSPLSSMPSLGGENPNTGAPDNVLFLFVRKIFETIF